MKNNLPLDVIGLTITYKDPVTMYLRVIGTKEENQMRQKLLAVSEDERAEKEYQINVNALADLAVSPEGADQSALISAQAVNAFFAEKTVIKERIAEYAMRAYFVKLQPEVSFL